MKFLSLLLEELVSDIESVFGLDSHQKDLYKQIQASLSQTKDELHRDSIFSKYKIRIVVMPQPDILPEVIGNKICEQLKSNGVICKQDPSKVDVRSLGGKFKEVEINATSFANNSVTLKKIISMLIESNKDSYENLVQLINLSTVVKYVNKEN